MDFAKAFSFPFEDPDWAKKILIPALIALIPIVGQIFLMGWSLDLTRRVIRRDPFPLPDLRFGDQLVDGLKAFLVALVYALPIIIVAIPMGLAVEAATPTGQGQNIVNILVTTAAVCCSSLIVLYGFLVTFVLPAAYARMVAAEDLGAAFRFKEVFDLLRKAPGAYLMVFLGTLLTGIIGGLGTILCLVGVVLTYTYAMAINGHLYGQAYNEATSNQGYARAY